MSDLDVGDFEEEQNYEEFDVPSSSEDEEEDLDKDEDFIDDVDQESSGSGQATSDYIDNLVQIDPEYLKRIPEKFTELQKEEILRLLKYRILVQRFGKKTIKLPISIDGIINNAKIVHKDKKPEMDTEGHIKKILYFIDEKLSTAFTLNIDTYSKEIYDHATFYIKSGILSSLASNLVIGKISREAVDMILIDAFNGLLRGIIDPGEMVGCQIATGLSEPLSQMTLNTFHLSGNSEKSKINQGMGRMSQIISYSKTDKILNDCYMFVYFKPQDEKNMDNIAKVISKFNTVNMYNLVETMTIIQDPSYLYGETSLIPGDLVGIKKYMKSGRKIPNGLSKLCIGVDFVAEEMYKVRFSMFDIENSLGRLYSDLFIIHINPTRIRIYVKGVVELDYFKNLLGSFKTVTLSGVENIIGVDINEEKVEYRKNDGTLSTRTINKLFAKGVNFREIISSKYINGYKSRTNDLQETLRTLGLNATKVVMYNEICSVYSANGANVSPAVVKMLVDAMTCKGFIAPINNIGMKLAESSTVQQMTFEKSEQVITDAALYAKKERVDGTSNNILFGQPFQGGTNAFKLAF